MMFWSFSVNWLNPFTRLPISSSETIFMRRVRSAFPLAISFIVSLTTRIGFEIVLERIMEITVPIPRPIIVKKRMMFMLE